MLKRFPWWVYALLFLCVCGAFAAILNPPKTQTEQTATLSRPAKQPQAQVPASPTRVVDQSSSPTTAPGDISTQASTQQQLVAAQPNEPNQPELIEAHVDNFIDGDTFSVIVNNKQYKVRIIGVDTPETVDPRKPVMCYGKEASAKTEELVSQANRRVLLEKDVSETDKYGRLLRYVWLDHPDGRRMLNAELVKGGFAQVSTYPPDVKYQQLFLDLQSEAREQNRGLWADCSSFGAPAATNTPGVAARPPTNTPIPAQPAKQPDWKSQGLPYNPFGPDRNCSAFSTQAEAQRFFIAAGGPAHDPHRLDADSDGVACETLP